MRKIVTENYPMFDGDSLVGLSGTLSFVNDLGGRAIFSTGGQLSQKLVTNC